MNLMKISKERRIIEKYMYSYGVCIRLYVCVPQKFCYKFAKNVYTYMLLNVEKNENAKSSYTQIFDECINMYIWCSAL